MASASAESRHSLFREEDYYDYRIHTVYRIPTPRGSIACELPPVSIFGRASPSEALGGDPMTVSGNSDGGAAAAEIASELAEADKPREEDAERVPAGTVVIGSATVGSAGKPW